MKIKNRMEVEEAVLDELLKHKAELINRLENGFPGITNLNDLELADLVKELEITHKLRDCLVTDEEEKHQDLTRRLNLLDFCKAQIESNDENEYVGIRKLGGHFEDQFWMAWDEYGGWNYEGWGSQPMLMLDASEYETFIEVIKEVTGQELPDMEQWADACAEMGALDKYVVWVHSGDLPTNVEHFEKMEHV